MPWNFVGNTVNFQNISESSSTDPLPLFGQPTGSGDQLLFQPTTFSSYSQGLAADQTDGHLTMTIALQPGKATSITSLVLNEEGDYTMNGARRGPRPT